jgi:hypothetical protein
MRHFARLCFFLLALTPNHGAESLKTKLVIFVSADGVRWQDVFRGADETLLNKSAGGIRSTELVARREWWRTDPGERRRIVMPFLWGTIARDGQVWGHRERGSVCDVANTMNFSYPGYSEFLCGFPDPAITSNDPIPNANTTVLEWLNGRDSARGRVGAVNCWTVLTAILNAERSKIPMWTFGSPTPPAWESPRVKQINELATITPVPWSSGTWDSFVYTVARDVLERTKPRVLYVNFGEPDEWAHATRYDRYLDSLRNVDTFLRGLWETAQSIPEYHGATTLLVTTDHGRGTGEKTWSNHGEKIPESGQTWFAVLGPDTPALGERTDVPPQKTAGAAATIAAFLGEDWPAAEPKAAKAWPVVHAAK